MVIDRKDGIFVIEMQRYKLFCCYCSENITIEEFRTYVNIPMNTVQAYGGEVIIVIILVDLIIT